ncbi:hypothetical protein [Paractinoplanes globisporus]|uniref:Uncharacterized protein n=1 Tax=Paractinoplanes globisporus TaxID=113565 RepID=A0ABW6WF72_9ACTN|nr:hypothetical protein [Actinoplanes globisporus]
MTTDRATATAWVREVAADRWDAALAARGFTRAAAALVYSRKVADDGRQRLHLDLSVRHGEFQLSPRATVAFPSIAAEATRLLGPSAADKSGVVDMELLDILDPGSPMLLFGTRDDLTALPVERYLLAPMVPWLDERTTVAAVTEAVRARADRHPGNPGRFPVIVAAGELAQGNPGGALATLERAYPEGSPGRTEYAAAFDEVRALAPGATPEPPPPAALSYQLTTANSLVGVPVPNPGPDQLERVVRRLNEERFYALLERSDGVYAQVGFGPKSGAAPGAYALEHRAGVHLRADTTDPDAAVRFLQRFRAGDDTWRDGHEWRRLEL